MRAQRASRGYRLHLAPLHRAVRSVVLATCLVMSLSILFTAGVAGESRALSVVAVAASVWSLRILWGPAVAVSPSGLRVQKFWPLRRDIPWYRVLQVEVVPGFWYIDVELNSGEHVVLPCVDDLDDLYERVERYRTDLDRVPS